MSVESLHAERLKRLRKRVEDSSARTLALIDARKYDAAHKEVLALRDHLLQVRTSLARVLGLPPQENLYEVDLRADGFGLDAVMRDGAPLIEPAASR